MNTNQHRELDFISELRLRQWARRNHVPAEERRDSQWHPVVLEEMQRRDAEEAQRQAPTIVTSSGVVPLIRSRHDIRIDKPHGRLPEPNLVQQRIVQKSLIPHCG